ncbi:MAG: hypothetical protein M3O25_12000 [Actinomycetota bacterium]|nr:hypothetical protein [Actinomycetota bacterium]
MALIGVFVGLLAFPTSAFAIRAGHNGPTRALEAAFKVAQFERAGAPDGCYPAPVAMAAAIRETGATAGVAAGLKAIRRPGVVYVIRRGAACGKLRMALLAKGELWVLDSAKGSLEVQGREGRRDDEAEPGARGPLRALTLTTRSFRLTTPDEPERFLVECPKGAFPLGGGMRTTPALGPDGEGAYPHSYERLGAQRGWHISAFLLDPSPGVTTPRKVTLQVVCGLGLVPISAPHKTVFLKSGQTKTAIARCPKGQYLVTGGYQRTNFVSGGGDFPTESRAIGTRAWRVSGRAFGSFGGELTAIAYCDRSKKPLLTEVSASTPLAVGQSATATTPACPKGRRLTAGGFSANGSHDTFSADGYFNPNGTWSTTSFGYFGPAPSLTAYGYCLRAR